MVDINVFRKLDRYIYNKNEEGLVFVELNGNLVQCVKVNQTNKEDNNGNTIYKVELNKGRIVQTILADLYMFPMHLEEYFMKSNKAFIDNCNIDCYGSFMYKNKVNVSDISISTSNMSYLNNKGVVSNRGESAMSITIFHNNGNKYVYCIPVYMNYHKVELKAIAIYIMDNFYNENSETMEHINNNYLAIYTENNDKKINGLPIYEYSSGVKHVLLDSLYTTVMSLYKSLTYSYKDNYTKNSYKLLDATRGYLDIDNKRIYTENGKHIYFIDNYKIISLATGIATIINLNNNEEMTVYCNICKLCTSGFISNVLNNNKKEYILNFNDVDGYDLTDVCEDYKPGREYDLRYNLIKLIKRGDSNTVYKIMEECGYVNEEEYEYDLNKLNLDIYEDEKRNLDFVEFTINNDTCCFYENGLFIIYDINDNKYEIEHDCTIDDIKDIIDNNEDLTIRFYINQAKEKMNSNV